MALVDVILTGGQSQMSGMGDGSLAPACDPDLCWEWVTGLPLVTVTDPNTTAPTQYQSHTGSPLPAFAKRFTQASGRPLVIVRAAVGGTAMLHANAGTAGDWSTDGTLFGDSVTRALAAISDVESLGHTINSVHVIWSQGYADAAKNNVAGYGDANAALVTRWRTALSQPGLKVYIELMYAPAAAPSQTVKDACLNIRAQELAAAAATDGLEIAFTDGQYYADWHWLRWDQLHYSQAGLNHMGEAFADYIASDLGLTPPPPTVGPPCSLTGRMLLGADPIYGNPQWITPGSYSWTVPPGVTSIGGEAIGSGGGGGGSNSLSTNGGGGGGGAYAADTVTVTPFETLTVVVAAGGAGGVSNSGGADGDASGIKRGDTWLVKAAGGKQGFNGSPYTGGAGGATADCVGSTKTAGTAGGTGASGGLGSGGAAASGGSLTGGAGGVGTTTAGGAAAASGAAPGGGGAGKKNGTAGSGGAGVVKINIDGES